MSGLNPNNVSDLLERFHPGSTSLAEALGTLTPLDLADITDQEEFYLKRALSFGKGTPERLRMLIGALEATSLEGSDNPERIRALCRRALASEEAPEIPAVAAVCAYPAFIETAREALAGSRVQVATVAGGFPDGQALTESKIAEVRACLRAGAQELDIPLNRGAFLEDRLGAVYAELVALREAAENATLKVILETCDLPDEQAVGRAGLLAALAGADFLQTSTGKGADGATLRDVIVMTDVIAQFAARTGRFVGLKLSGGVGVELALAAAAAVEERLGLEALGSARFRIGDSSLLEGLTARLREVQGYLA
jgi:deoxyribose-phosphate aldolase